MSRILAVHRWSGVGGEGAGMGDGLWTPCMFCLLNVWCGVDGDVGVKESDIPCSAVFCLCIKDARRGLSPLQISSQ